MAIPAHLLSDCGHRLHQLATVGLVNQQGRDSFFHRIIFPCEDQDRIVNLYWRSIGLPPPHRFLLTDRRGLLQDVVDSGPMYGE